MATPSCRRRRPGHRPLCATGASRDLTGAGSGLPQVRRRLTDPSPGSPQGRRTRTDGTGSVQPTSATCGLGCGTSGGGIQRSAPVPRQAIAADSLWLRQHRAKLTMLPLGSYGVAARAEAAATHGPVVGHQGPVPTQGDEAGHPWTGRQKARRSPARCPPKTFHALVPRSSSGHRARARVPPTTRAQREHGWSWGGWSPTLGPRVSHPEKTLLPRRTRQGSR
jgi:hypothetical protein